MHNFFSFSYLFLLMIAPQIWYPPIQNVRTDLYLYPLWMIYILATGRIINYKFDIQTKFLIIWLFWIIVSMVANGVPLQTGNILYNYFKMSLIFILIITTLSETKYVERHVFFMIVIAIILSFEGIAHYHSIDGIGWAGQPLGWVDDPGAKGRTQWVGIFDGPGVFCVIYTMVLPFLLVAFRESKKNGMIIRLFLVSVIILLLIAIFFNGSRGGLLTVLVIIGIIYGFDKTKKISLFKKLIIGAFVFIVLVMLPSHMTQVSDGHDSSSKRVDMWAEGVEMVQQNPLFGIGKGRFLSYTGELIAHNSAIEIMGETGVVGLYLWIGLIYFSLIKLYYFLKQSESENLAENMYAKALFISIIGYIVSSMFVTLEYETFYMLLGLCAAYGNKLENPIYFDQFHCKNILFITFSWLVFIKFFTLVVDPSSL